MGQLEKPNSMPPLITSGRATKKKKEIKNKESYVIVFHKELMRAFVWTDRTESFEKKREKEKNKEFAGSIQITCCIGPGEKRKKKKIQKASRSTRSRSRRINKSIKSDEITIATNLRCDNTTSSMSNQNFLSLCCSLCNVHWFESTDKQNFRAYSGKQMVKMKDNRRSVAIGSSMERLVSVTWPKFHCFTLQVHLRWYSILKKIKKE